MAGASGEAQRAQELAVDGGPGADSLVARGGDQEAALAVGVEVADGPRVPARVEDQNRAVI
jgi:hypothetical protein